MKYVLHVTLTLTLSVQGHTVSYVYFCIYVCSRWIFSNYVAALQSGHTVFSSFLFFPSTALNVCIEGCSSAALGLCMFLCLRPWHHIYHVIPFFFKLSCSFYQSYPASFLYSLSSNLAHMSPIIKVHSYWFLKAKIMITGSIGKCFWNISNVKVMK